MKHVRRVEKTQNLKISKERTNWETQAESGGKYYDRSKM